MQNYLKLNNNIIIHEVIFQLKNNLKYVRISWI